MGAGIYCAEYGGGLAWIVRFVADVLNGTPSIVVGIFAWTWIVDRQTISPPWPAAWPSPCS